MQSDKNYSTIVATLPDPTVRPPSRLNVNYIYLESLDFTWFLFAHISCFASFLVVFEIFRAILEPAARYSKIIMVFDLINRSRKVLFYSFLKVFKLHILLVTSSCKRQVVFHKLRHLIFQKMRQIIFHSLRHFIFHNG